MRWPAVCAAALQSSGVVVGIILGAWIFGWTPGLPGTCLLASLAFVLGAHWRHTTEAGR